MKLHYVNGSQQQQLNGFSVLWLQTSPSSNSLAMLIRRSSTDLGGICEAGDGASTPVLDLPPPPPPPPPPVPPGRSALRRTKRFGNKTVNRKTTTVCAGVASATGEMPQDTVNPMDGPSARQAARKARRDKRASRREKKATKTLAIVLGAYTRR